MTILVLGLVIFIGVHIVTTQRELRSRLISQWGAGPYKIAYSLISIAGVILIAIGFSRYRAAGYIDIWMPPPWTRHVTLTLMWFSFVALASAYSPHGRIAGWLKHPMLVAVKIWALAHLLANGDLGSIILFGAILAYAVFDRIAVKRRGDAGAAAQPAFTRGDAIAVAAGSIGYLAMLALHPILIRVSALG
jgi:uncharacterized membrane protein